MKNILKTVVFLFLVIGLMPAVWAQSSNLNGVSLNGSTGLFSIPSGRIGWGRDADLGLDFGYHAIINDKAAHIPTVTASLMKWVELSLAFDIQPDYLDKKNDDLLFGFKLQLPTNAKNASNPAVALGTSLQAINVGDDDVDYTAIQVYAAATYAGTFFSMPAETTVVMGKTFYSGRTQGNNSDIDFGMGFDLILLPKVFQNFVHWIIDFSNFDYSSNSWPNALAGFGGASWYRGIFSTGFRINLASIPALSKYKFIIDVIFNDLFDHDERSFTVGAAFGIPIM
jgi:hypothetical protein